MRTSEGNAVFAMMYSKMEKKTPKKTGFQKLMLKIIQLLY